MEIKVATTMDELKKVAALRYSVFVQEQGRSSPFADATQGTLLEPVDAFHESTVVYTQEGEEIAASIRVEHRIPDWVLYQIDPIPGGFFNLKSCFLSGAVSSATNRGTRHFDALGLWLGENILAPNYELFLLICKLELVDLFMQYAFQPSQFVVKHPDGVSLRILASSACSDGVRGTRNRALAGRFKYELAMERKAELYRWLKL